MYRMGMRDTQAINKVHAAGVDYAIEASRE
jgi:hypothetical protein